MNREADGDRLDCICRWGFPLGYVFVTVLIAGLVVFMFLVSLLDAVLWAHAYLRVGAFEQLDESLYFSMVTFTTLGYGDITLSSEWRLLASFQAANGIIIFGWTTALVAAVIQRLAPGRNPDN